MGNTTKKIVIQADVVAALQGMDKVVNQLQKGLQEGTTSTDLSKGMGNNLSKLMEKFRKEYSQFTNMTKDGGLDFSRASEGLKTGKSLIQTFEELQRIMGNISTKSVVDLKKMFPEAFDSRIDGLRDSMSSLLRDLDSLASKRVTKTSLENDVTQLTTKVEALKKELVDEATLQIKSDAATQTSQKVEELGQQLDDLRKKLGDELQLKISANTRDTKKLETEAAEIQKRMQSADKNFSADGKKYKGKTQKEWENSSESGQAKAGARKAFENRAQDSKRTKEISNQLRQLEREKEDLVAANTKYKTGGDLTKVSQGMGQNAEEIAKVTQLQVDYADAVKKSKQAAEELDAAQKGNKSAQDAIAKDTRAIEEKTEKINNLGNQIENLEKKTSAVNIGEKFKEIAPNFDFSPELLKSEEGLRTLYAELAKIEQTQADELIKDLEGIGLNAEQAKKGVEVLRDGLDGAAEKVREISQAEKDMENLKNRMLQFFSLTNSIQLFRRAVTSAMNTVKELDATMTEAAVVTNFSIGDMWEKLPEYSAQAQKLGVSINDMYQATTLYYQQGLKNNEAMALGVETMKMARIAGMESAEATEAMTAALRGFNMELNETSAVRVNDVYSQLAAVTAADTEQIATAMSKTASIASAANMEFEATAAFLAQIIETTQEAPETAGTALKTIIARFSEVKSLRDQGLSSGQDAEGEAIDVNKIQTALRSVGISMEGFFAGTEGLDSVLLKLAEKWDTLDFETQRYIATMAAGSRQQSRFIAMMSDYGRTTELVGAAQNSAGASQKQFAKTAESLEAKLTKLKNAWDQFVMGIANDELIKFGVDALTEILNAVNNLTKGLPGLTKSFANLGLAFGGIMLGKKAVGGLLGSVGKSLGEGMGITPKEEVTEKVGGSKIVKSAKDIKIQQRSVVTDKETREQIKYMKQLNQERTKTRLAMREKGADIQRLNAQYQNLNVQYNIEKEALKEMTSAYVISGGALDKLNTEEKEALAIAVMNNHVTKEQLADMDEEALKRFLVAAGVKAEEEANEDLNEEKVKEVALNHKGILGLIEAIGLRVMGKKAIQGETMSLKALVAEKWKNVAATIAENAALIAGVAVVLAVVAAIAMLVVGITKMNQAWKDSANNSKKIEKVNDQINEMQEQLTESREELNKLTESRTNLEQLQETFEGLTRGTEEWKQKLVEVNGAVLDLIQEHPELAGYITKGESGQLTIRAEGWDAAIAAIEQQIATAVTTQTGLQMKKNHLEQQQALADSSNYFAKQKQIQDYWKSEETKDASGWIIGGAGVAGGAVLGAKAGAAIGTALGTVAPGIGNAIGAVAGTLIGGAIGGLAGFTLGHIAPDAVDALNGTIQDAEKEATGGLTQDEFMAFAAKAQERGVTWTSGATQDEFKQIYTEMGYDESIWPDVYEKIQQMGTEFDSLAASSLELRTAQDAYMTSLVSGLARQAGVDNSEFYDQITEITATSGADKQGEIAAEAEKILSDSDYTDKNGEAKDKLIEEYAAVMGMEKDAVNEKIEAGGLGSDTMAQAIAQNKVDKELIAEMQRLEKVMSSLPKSAEGLKNALTSEGKDLKLKDIQEFKNLTGLTGELSEITDTEAQKEAVERYLASQDTSLSALGLDEGDDWKLIWENFVAGSNAFSESAEKIKSWGGQLNQTVTAGAAKALASKIEEQTSTGAVGAKEVLDTITKIESDLTDEQVQQFYEALGSFDWENLSSVESLSAMLGDLGFDMNLLGGAVQILEDKIIGFANSVPQLTPEQQAQEIDIAEDLIKALKTEGKNRFFTVDEARAIFGEDYEEHFVGHGTKRQYSGSLSAIQLINKIEERYGMSRKTEKQFQAYAEREAAKNRTGTYEFITVKGTYPALTGSPSHIGESLHFDPSKVRKSQVVTYVNSRPKSNVYSVATAQRTEQQNTTYAERLKAAKLQENSTNYQGLFGKANDYDRKIYELWKINTGYALTGLHLDASMDEVASWYEGLDTYGKEYFGAIAGAEAGGVRTNEEWFGKLIEEHYMGYDSVAAAVGTFSTGSSNDWNILRQIAEGKPFQDEGSFYTTEEIGQLQLSQTEINRLYKEYINDGATQVVDQANALAKYYKEIDTALTNVEEEEYQQEMAFFSGQELLSATEDSRLKVRQDVANDVLDARVNSIAGGNEIVDKWIQGLKETDSALAKNKKAVQALAVAYDSFNTEIDDLNSVLGEEIDYFALGTKAGERYYEALVNIKNAAQGALGEHIDTTFVEDTKDLFIELQKGGEAAQVAWEQLTQKSFEKWLETTGQSKKTLRDIADYIASQPLQIGVATKIEGTDEMLANWDAVVAGMTTKGITMVKTESGQILATKSDYTGTGLGVTDNAASEKWENPYDKFYNTLERINEAMRQREKLERQYQKLIEKGEASANKLTEKKNQQLAALQREAELQNDIIAGREDQINNLIKEKGLSQYAYLGKNEFTGKSELRIDWDEINKIPDSKKGEEVQDYISKLEEWFGSIEDAEDSLEEIEDNADKLKEEGKDEYLDLEQTIKDALVESYQKQIDELSNINDSINDANSKMLEAMQEQINAYRQSRGNEKAENEIADKQARLAYLQQDTSGANATEILQLEKEIAEAQEGHIDNLIDQKINELQQQNDKAAEQRERQISIAEAQLEQYETSGQIWNEVNKLMREGLNPDTGLVTGKKLETILKDKAGFDGMSKIEKMEWLTQTNTDIASALSYLDALDGKLEEINLNKNSNNNPDLSQPDGDAGQFGYNFITGLQSDSLQDDLEGSHGSGGLYDDFKSNKPGITVFDGHVTYRAFKDRNGVPWVSSNPLNGQLGTIFWKGKLHKIDHAFKTGGLADYTGPAWLDGTKSKPELVLNARDTQNFIQLKDILASLMSNTPGKTSEKSGDMNFDIDINVETINDETDLDMIANYIENKIVSSANYRNNTIVGSHR